MWDVRYRPLRFSDVLGQEGSIKLLKSRIKKGTAFDTSYIFAGKHGRGKTTLSRIYARAMLCQNLDKNDPEPCNECSSCKRHLIEQHPAFSERDAATNDFVSRGAMDIDGMGEERAMQFLRAGLIADVADIFALDKERLVALEGFGELSADALLESIERSRTQTPFFRVLYALGIPGIGYVNARAIALQLRSMDALLEATPEQIVETPGIGPVLADTIVETLEEDRTRELIERLRGHGLQMEQEGPAPGTEGPLVGKTFVITGTLPNMSREKAAESIEQAGGKVTNSVSKKTDYLVVGADPGGSKFNKAQEIGTEQIDEAALVELLEG